MKACVWRAFGFDRGSGSEPALQTLQLGAFHLWHPHGSTHEATSISTSKSALSHRSWFVLAIQLMLSGIVGFH